MKRQSPFFPVVNADSKDYERTNHNHSDFVVETPRSIDRTVLVFTNWVTAYFKKA